LSATTTEIGSGNLFETITQCDFVNRKSVRSSLYINASHSKTSWKFDHNIIIQACGIEVAIIYRAHSDLITVKILSSGHCSENACLELSDDGRRTFERFAHPAKFPSGADDAQS